MFGGLLIERGGRHLPPIPSRIGRSLFAYLVMHRTTAPTRDLLAGRFWPDLAESQARRRLSQALWQIQSVLGDRDHQRPFLVTSLDAVRFDSAADLWLDVDVFDAAVGAIKVDSGATAEEIRNLEAAVDLYRGDFLAGFYEDWILVEQERLRELYFYALGHLTRLHKSRGDFAAGLLYARRLALQDPLREEAHREVMRLCFLLGRNNEALQQFERCRAILGDELGTTPDAETRSLYEHIAAQKSTPHHPSSDQRPVQLFEARGRIPLVGRESERRAVVARMERSIAGDGGLVLIEGEAGMGKTRLLEEIAEDAHWRGMQVLWGRADPAAQPAFGVLAGALESAMSPLRAEQLRQRLSAVWLSELGRLTPALAEWIGDEVPPQRLRPAEEASRMLEALRSGLAAMSDITPALVVLDDVHWADDDSLRALEHLAFTGLPDHLLMAVSYRQTEARDRPALWRLLRSLDALAERIRITVHPLDATEVAELVHHTAPQGPWGRVVGRLHADTGGNPFFVLETMRAVHERHVEAAVSGNLSDPDPLPVPRSVADLIAGRLTSLTPEARRVITTLAVLDRDADLDTVRLAAEVERAALLEAVHELVGRGVVFDDHGVFRFGHDQVRRVVLAGVAPGDLGPLHLAAGLALEAIRPDGVEALAYHFTAAGDRARAAHYLEAAGRRAVERRAYDGAADHFSAAATLTTDAADRARLLLALEEVADVLARRDVQETALADLESLPLDEPAVRHEIAVRRARLAAALDRFDDATTVATAALDAARAAGRRDLEASALTALGTIAILSGMNDDAIATLFEAEHLAEAANAIEVSINLGKALASRQRYGEARERLRSAADAALAAGDDRNAVEALGSLAVVLMEQGEIDRARSLYGESSLLSEQIGYRYGQGRAAVNLGNLEYFAGNVAAAVEHYDEAAALFAAIGNRRGAAMVHANLASLRHEIFGDDDAAAEDARIAFDYFTAVGDQAGVAQALDVVAGIAVRRGDAAAAAVALDDAVAALEAANDAWLEIQVLLTRARSQLATGNTIAAHRTLEGARKLSDAHGIEEFVARISVLEAAALLNGGDADSALLAIDGVDPGELPDRFFLEYVRWKALLELDRSAAAAASLEAAAAVVRDLLPAPEAAGVPEHREVLEARAVGRPRQTTVRLAHRAAPRGRPLHDGELVDVCWTIFDRADLALAEGADRRRAQLVRLVEEASACDAVATVADLAAALGVSSATVRRDLSALRGRGIDVRTRGSAG